MFFSLVLVAGSACGGGGGEKAAPTPPASTGSDIPVERDLVDLARRLRGQPDAPRQVALPKPALGAEEQFDLLELPAHENEPPGRRTATATLRAVSDHAYFFIENGAGTGDAQVDAAVHSFEDEVWPKVTAVFGEPPAPGVDGDPRIVILHARLSESLSGYVNGEDSYPRQVAPRSNGREIVYLNLSIPLDSAAYARVLAHELQHLIHRRADASEDAWINEGVSEVSAALVGGGAGFFGAFLDQSDTQLNGWSGLGSSATHYGASALFLTYLFEQTGASPGQLAAEPGDGVEGVRALLRDVGEPRSFEDVVADWASANVLDEPNGPYGYVERDVGPAKTQPVIAAGAGEGEVSQFGTDYLEFDAADFASPPTFTFDGDAQTPVIPGQTDARGAFWWSGRGDSIDSTLTRELDLTGVKQATLTFRTWFDIERWFDFGYVEVSQDGGKTWTALAGNQTTAEDPLEVSYGPGYSGRSGGGETPGWVDERIDLSPYTGSRVLVRFELVNDDSTDQAGWAVDDIAVPETGFIDGAEADPGGWQRAGFRRVSEPQPQRFALRLLTPGRTPLVETIPLDATNQASVTLDGLGTAYQRAIIAIVGETDGTAVPAGYRYDVTAEPRTITLVRREDILRQAQDDESGIMLSLSKHADKARKGELS